MKKTIQYFTKEYLERCSGLTPDQIIEFLEDYRNLVTKAPDKCQLISLKIEPLTSQSIQAKSKQ